MIDTAPFDQILSERIPQNPHLVVFDPGQQWPDIQQSFQGYDLPLGVYRKIISKSGKAFLAFRTHNSSIPDSSLLISIVPKGGFDRGQTDTIKNRVVSIHKKNHHHLIVALVDEDELKPPAGVRCIAGYKTLEAELKREFGTVPFIFPRSTFRDICSRVLRSFEDLAHEGNAVIGWSSIFNILQEIGSKIAAPAPYGMVGFEGAIEALCCGRKAEGILAGIHAAKQHISKASQAQQKYFDRWTELTGEGRDKCAAAARGAKNFGSMADEIFPGDSNVVKEMRDRLNSTDWVHPPYEDLGLWRDAALESLRTSDVVFPIVGIFSSGKTTLLNRIIGRSPKGHFLLRTSNTHNTALLCRFHCTRPQDRSRVAFTWKDRVENVSLLEYSPSDPERSRAETGIHDIRRPKPLNHLTIKPREVRSFLKFLRGETLEAVRFQVMWREPFEDSSRDVTLTRQIVRRTSKGYNHLIKALEKMVGMSQAEKELIDVPIWRGERVPVQVTMSADLADSAPRIAQHDLVTDEDWDWFQGTIADDENTNRRQPGFAESIEAEYLISQADIYLENPLFELVSLVDTPGLNSVTEHHDQITEEYIRRGRLFLMMAKLGEASGHKDSPRLLDLMMQALKDNRIRRDREERIFLVLNWFRTQVGARNEADATKRVREFADLAKRNLNATNVRLYVVDLSPDALAQPRPKEMLGFPSLAPLLQDLKSFITDYGLSDRFAALEQQLTGVWNGHLKALQRTIDELESKDPLTSSRQKLQQTLLSFTHNSNISKQLFTLATDAANEILHIHDRLSSRLSRLDKKEDFKEFMDRGMNLLNEFNDKRGYLGEDLAKELTARLRSRLRGLVDTLPFVRAPMDLLTNIPTMPLESFKRAVEKMVDDWPYIFIRALRRVTHPFESYAVEQRNILLSRFFPVEGEQSIKNALDVLMTRYNNEIEKACNVAIESIEQRLAQFDMNELELKKLRQSRKKDQLACDAFMPKVEWMQRTLLQNAKQL